jgi:hypothetical protein
MATKKSVVKKKATRKTSRRKAATKKVGITGDAVAVFAALRAVLAKHEKSLVVKDYEPGRYYLNTTKPNPRNQAEMFFGAVVVMKRSVSFHLMPVYAFPDMLKQATPELRKRMQGKSCFHFKTVEPALFRELDALTREGLERFKAAGLA